MTTTMVTGRPNATLLCRSTARTSLRPSQRSGRLPQNHAPAQQAPEVGDDNDNDDNDNDNNDHDK